MKECSIGLLALSFCLGVSSQASNFIEVPIHADQIYAPHGFDSNDFSEVVVTGWLPTTCHSRPKAVAQTNGQKIQLSVTATRDVSGAICIDMAMPFVAVAELGRLIPQDYQVKANSDTRTINAKIAVVEPESIDTDNHLYARVESVLRVSGTRRVKLIGVNPSDCIQLREVKLISNGVNTFSVLPVMEKVQPTCPQRPTPFEYEIDVPRLSAEGKDLLHIRSMSGNSVNFVLEQ